MKGDEQKSKPVKRGESRGADGGLLWKIIVIIGLVILCFMMKDKIVGYEWTYVRIF